ncbi:NUDIX hydrolase domain-like protein [Podospora fimiseda]|uniref:NUDIX hydrolase domain-like protein n=1 Tax=Podospora fimiseda TaxID=252190 RepID=A0AAN7BIS0_9PEZI|nr:NUDIX hydrolase domain-like protein [Podospora fimiseda]
MASPAYTFSPVLQEFEIPVADYLKSHTSLTGGLVVSALIFHHFDDGSRRILLIQRAATDGFPLKWEIPGGAAEITDKSVFDGVCREVLEETGLKVTKILRKADTKDEWEGRRGGRWRKITFVVEVEGSEDRKKTPKVKLSPEEHQDFGWVTLEEIENTRFEDGTEIEFAYEKQRGTILGLF